MTSFRPIRNVLPEGTPTRTGTDEGVSRKYFSSYERCYPAVICLSLGASEGPEWLNGRPTGKTVVKPARWGHNLHYENHLINNAKVKALAKSAGVKPEEVAQAVFDIVNEAMNSALKAEDSTPWPGFKFNPTRNFKTQERDQDSKAQLMMDIAPIVDKHEKVVQALVTKRDATPETQAIAADIEARQQEESATEALPF